MLASELRAIEKLRAPSDRARILVLTTTLPAKPGDGTPEFVLSLASALADRFEVIVLAPRVKEGPRAETVDGVEIRRFPYFPRRWEGLADGAILANLKAEKWRILEAVGLVVSFLAHALALAKSKRPHVVHAHWILPAGAVALAIRKLMGIPYVVTIHGADAYALRGWAFEWLKRKVLEAAATISPVSSDIGSLVGLSEVECQRVVVPMGVDVDALRRSVGERTPVPGRFLFVGRLVDKKGLDVLIRALSNVRDAQLVVVGDGPSRKSLETLAEQLGIQDRISFRGALPRHGVFEELRRAYAFVIPSRPSQDGDQDGTPVVLAEAMAAGVPVIASRLGGMADWIRDETNGLLVEPGSVPSLTEALRRALDDTQFLDRVAERALAVTAKSLDLANTSNRYAEFLVASAGLSR